MNWKPFKRIIVNRFPKTPCKRPISQLLGNYIRHTIHYLPSFNSNKKRKGDNTMGKGNLIENVSDIKLATMIIVILLVIIITLAGVVVFDNDVEDDDESIHRDNQAYVDLLSIHISDELIENQKAVESLATNPEILTAFTNGSTEDIEKANAVLDHYKESYNVTYCYLMNETGVTIASTNRDSNTSFVGHNYGFRSYFKDAMEGDLGHCFVLGATTGTRGYHSSFPVKDDNGTIVGVAVIKIMVDYLEESFTTDDYCFLVSPDGIIFLSSDPNLLMNGLWVLDQTTKDDLITSNEFGDGPFDALLKDEPVNGNEVDYDGESYRVYRKAVHENGWSIVLLNVVD